MSDIVERWRLARGAMPSSADEYERGLVQAGDALAAEIERLRAEVSEIEDTAVRISRMCQAAEAQRDALARAAEPFHGFSGFAVTEHGWASNIHRERISTWFGPSDFRALAAAVADARGGKDGV